MLDTGTRGPHAGHPGAECSSTVGPGVGVPRVEGPGSVLMPEALKEVLMLQVLVL